MLEDNTPASQVQQTPLARRPRPILSGHTNSCAEERDLFRTLNPHTSFGCFNEIDDRLSVYFGPGQGTGPEARREVERAVHTIGNPHVFPSFVEIEFSASPTGVFPAAEGLPEDYRASAIAWALDLSAAVLIAVYSDTNSQWEEPRTLVRPVQTVFRCTNANVNVWRDYLARRVRPRQHFAIVHLATLVRR